MVFFAMFPGDKNRVCFQPFLRKEGMGSRPRNRNFSVPGASPLPGAIRGASPVRPVTPGDSQREAKTCCLPTSFQTPALSLYPRVPPPVRPAAGVPLRRDSSGGNLVNADLQQL